VLALAADAGAFVAGGGQDVGWRALALRQRRHSCSLRAKTAWPGVVGGADNEGADRPTVTPIVGVALPA
jgi:hypothetical protein